MKLLFIITVLGTSLLKGEVIKDIKQSPYYNSHCVDIGGSGAGFQVASTEFPSNPRIHICLESKEIFLDVEPGHLYVSFDGGMSFRYLHTAYEATRYSIDKEYNNLIFKINNL